MKLEQDLGRKLHIASNLLARKMNSIISSNGAEGITPIHGMILGFVNMNREQGCEVYQKDIEAEFDIARSTVTATLKLMEKKGYIRREDVAHDARLKSIFLTPLGKESLNRIESSIHQTEELMRNSLTGQEYSELMRLLDRIKSVL